MRLHDLRAPAGANKARKRVGRGESSGHGKTAGRGGKGQTARTGKGKVRLGFEGGQVPMYRRMPKRGFTNIHAIETIAVNVGRLAQFFKADEVVDLAALQAKGLARRRHVRFRLLGQGEITFPLVVKAHHMTPAAKAAIEACGGKCHALGQTEQA